MSNSKTVILKKCLTFTQIANDELEEYYSDSNRHVGGYLDGRASGTGLTFEEKRLLMPEILGIPHTDRDFQKQVENYFADITTRVTSSKGTILEIGLATDNKAPVSENNFPINLRDYLSWRHAKSHPQVALSEQAAKGDQTKKWYIVDSEKTAEFVQELTNTKDEAMALYLTVKTSKEKVRQILTNISERNLDKVSDLDRMTDLRKIAEDNPERFVKVAQDKDLEVAYKVRRAIQLGVLNRVGERVIDKAGNQIGGNITEAIAFWKDPSQSETVGLIIAQCKEKSKQESI